MADTELIKYARARDDQDFVWRVAAAVLLEARYKFEANPVMSLESRKLMEWALDSPLTAPPLMVAFVAADAAVASGVVVDNGAVITSGASDAAIKAAVGASWETVARQMFLPEA
ncbi:hypothetical protein PQD80_gp21 [Arthrobacter phage Lizalica]|uniref:Uncharacterized protein n=1 Tax=Arthrobacter phage Lizalica TaxID=2832319 RepID=A0AA48Y3X5_9CAUD|nr:hypothetical protein PQD80_gp21 [Arthrobacter phage Lizalica]UIW13505.1 hypothetical protein SEA_LIZALICA_21 [Arthrobacter phage Lizalica]